MVPSRTVKERYFFLAKGDDRRFARPAMLLLTSVAIVSLLFAGSHFFTSESNRREYAAPSNPSAASGSSGQANDPDSATAWDVTAGDIDIYREDITPFEMRSQQLWDATPELKQD